MSRTFRALTMIYAAAMVVVSAGFYWHERRGGDHVLFAYTGAVSLCYVVLALAYLVGKDRERTPTRPWLAAIYALLLTPPAVTLLMEDGPSRKEVAVSAGWVLACLAVTVFLLLDLQPERLTDHARMRRWLVSAAILGGAGLVWSSLFVDMTAADTGWHVVMRKVPWITAQVNVATPISGNSIDWLQPIFKPGGYFLYLISLLSTLILPICFFVTRGSVDRLQASAVVTRDAALIAFTCFWIQTDIFWGWHLDLGNVPWAAVTAACLWLGAPLFGGLLLLPFVRGVSETWRVRAFLVFQLPVAAFNFLMLFAYFGDDMFLHMPGLGMLIVGLQIESWACMDLLSRGRRTMPVVGSLPLSLSAKSA